MLVRKTLRTVDDLIYMAPSSGGIVIHAMYFANTTAARRSFRLHHVQSGQSSATHNALFYDVAIAENGTVIDSTRIAMEPGDQLRGLADADGVTLTIYGLGP